MTSNEIDHLPSEIPELLSPVNGVWIASDMGPQGIRWDGKVWRSFNVCGESVDG